MITVIGVDTGDTAGLVRASWQPGTRIPVAAQAFQCDRAAAAGLLRWQLDGSVTAVQIEAFDDRPKRGGLAGTSPSLIRAQVAGLAEACRQAGVPVFIVTAAEMKLWATDARLKATKVLWELTRGMPRHAADGGRHAMACAVKHCGLPDPLSRQVNAIREGAGDAPG